MERIDQEPLPDNTNEKKVVLITGALGSLGKGIANTVKARTNYGIILQGRPEKEKELAALAQELDAKYVTYDASDREQVQAAVPRVEEILGSTKGRLQVVYDMIGAPNPKPLLQLTEDDFNWAVKANVLPATFQAQAFMPMMEKSGGGVWIVASSVRADERFVNPNNTQYGSSKRKMEYVMAGFEKLFKPEVIKVFTPRIGMVGDSEMARTKWTQAVRDEASITHSGQPITTQYVADALVDLSLSPQGERVSYIDDSYSQIASKKT